MGELIVWLLLFILLAVIAFYAGWILLAVLARVFSLSLIHI